MTDIKRDREANNYLTKLLREKTGDSTLEVTRIRPEGRAPDSVTVETQTRVNETTFKPNKDIIVSTGIHIPAEVVTCLDRRVLDRIVENWPIAPDENE